MSQDYIRGEFKGNRAGARLMAIVAEGERGRVYLPPTADVEAIALTAKTPWKPEQEMNQDSKDLLSGRGYGFKYWHELFTPRQLVALTTFADLVSEARERVKCDAIAAGLPGDDYALNAGGVGALAYAESVGMYLGLAMSRFADRTNSLCTWDIGPVGVKSSTGGSARTASVTNLFKRQAIPMSWDFAEANPFSESGGSYVSAMSWVVPAVSNLNGGIRGSARFADAAKQTLSADKIISTDPPYYNNVSYADLSDFFYIWLRHSFRPFFPDLFATLLVPKAEELVATPYRHGTKDKAESFFLKGMTQAMHRLAEQAHPGFPVTIYYAFKQAETESDEGSASTGWETFLDAVIRAGFAVSGTWPMRTELTAALKKRFSVLASSILLVCRPRMTDAPTATRRDFLSQLKAELPQALADLQRGNIAPVDLAQAAIGPGMAVYTHYSKVLDAEGKPLSVRQALALINETLDEVLTEQEGDFDADSRWAVTWFEQSGFGEGDYGVAEQLSKSKNTSVSGMAQTGILYSRGGKVRLFRPDELSADWDPDTDPRLTAWETVHQLIRSLESGGEGAAAELVAKLGAKAEVARELAYRLYTASERKKRAAEALSYNGLVQS
jgi:putative DNA methylase